MDKKGLKGREGKKYGSYYKRILIFLLVFTMFIIIPFTAILYNKSESNVLNSINQSNERMLKQMKFNYSYFSNNMSMLCLSTFLRYDVKEMMYNDELNFNDEFLVIKNLKDNIIQTNPSLQSISIYNSVDKIWYSTDGKESGTTDELNKYLMENKEIPKLKPILRRVSTGTDNIEAYSYVFSYFMYEYSNPRTCKDSFIVLNQKADEFINNLNDGIAGKYPIFLYMTDKEGNSYSSQKVEDQRQEVLVQECIAENMGDEKEGFYVKKMEDQKYLISYIDLGDDTNYIVMLQNYQDIFNSMLELRNDFILLCIVYAVAAFIGLILISKRIYNPVNKLVNYVFEVSTFDSIEKENQDEIGQLKKVFQKTNSLNKTLRQEKKRSHEIVENYWLRNLLNDSSKENWKTYYNNMPETVLGKVKNYNLAVICLHLDGYCNNKYAFAEDDCELLLKSVINVMQEIMEPAFEMVSVYWAENDMVIILNGLDSSCTPEHIVKNIKSTQDFIKKHFDVAISTSYSEISNQPTSLSILYENARKYEKYRIVYGKDTILGKKECNININNGEVVYPRRMQKKLDEGLKLGNKEQIYEVLNEIQGSISTLSYDNIIINLMSLVTTINTLLNEINRMKDYPTSINFSKMYQAVLEVELLDELFEELKEYIDSVLMNTYQTKVKESTDEKVFVETVIKFVHENYTNINLSSQSIGDYMNMSSRYIMKKFKKCTNLSLNEYIFNVRMKQAVHLLTNTNMSVSQVTKSIGIENENYFYRLFKKAYGCTPREFAKKCN